MTTGAYAGKKQLTRGKHERAQMQKDMYSGR